MRRWVCWLNIPLTFAHLPLHHTRSGGLAWTVGWAGLPFYVQTALPAVRYFCWRHLQHTHAFVRVLLANLPCWHALCAFGVRGVLVWFVWCPWRLDFPSARCGDVWFAEIIPGGLCYYYARFVVPTLPYALFYLPPHTGLQVYLTPYGLPFYRTVTDWFDIPPAYIPPSYSRSTKGSHPHLVYAMYLHLHALLDSPSLYFPHPVPTTYPHVNLLRCRAFACPITFILSITLFCLTIYPTLLFDSHLYCVFTPLLPPPHAPTVLTFS